MRLSREEAVGFALPQRTAVLGIAPFDTPSGHYAVVVAATALRERDRERRAEFRLVSSVLVAAGLVLAFGGIARRKQRKELELASRLSIRELEQERDAQLVHIDKLATMGALATGIAHEVSTPLGVILGRAEQLLPKMKDDERAKRSVESILEQGTRINGVIRGFLNLARGEAPSIEHISAFRGRTRVRGARGAQIRQSRGAARRARARRPPPDPVRAAARRTSRDQLTPQCVRRLRTRRARSSLDVGANGDHVRFVVTDDGAGISEEASARAVEPFFTTKPAGEGTGLGLAIANEIVKNHGGKLDIGPRRDGPSGAPHKGSRASVELPFRKEA